MKQQIVFVLIGIGGLLFIIYAIWFLYYKFTWRSGMKRLDNAMSYGGMVMGQGKDFLGSSNPPRIGILLVGLFLFLAGVGLWYVR